MRVLVIKTSSLGDVIHTLPALSDAAKQYPDIQFDWIVEESFQTIPNWHQQIHTVLPIALRRWRKSLFSPQHHSEIRQFIHNIRQQKYDYIIDAQGLLKSALLSFLLKGKVSGYAFDSAREKWASLFYQQKIRVPLTTHAIYRNRRLFSEILKYEMPASAPDYGIEFTRIKPYSSSLFSKPYYAFLHGTTWTTKEWPEAHWITLSQKIAKQGFDIALLWGNDKEKKRAEKIAALSTNAHVVPYLNLNEIAWVLKEAEGIVSVDTGLGHLGAAFNKPTVSLYGATDPKRSGLLGAQQIHLQNDHLACIPCLKRHCLYQTQNNLDSPCLAAIQPEQVWSALLAFRRPVLIQQTEMMM